MAATEEQQKEAIALGWAPKDQWRGPEEHWVDADVFIERGKTILPIMKENNQRLTADNQRLAGEVDRLKHLVENGQASIEEFKKFHSEEMKRAVTKAKRDLRIEIEKARKDGDVEGAVELQEQLDDLDESSRQLAEGKAEGGKPAGGNGKDTTEATTVTPQLKAEWDVWAGQNTWYGQDPVKTGLMNGLSAEYRNNPNENQALTGKAFWEEIGRRVEAYGKPAARTPNKVEGAGGGGGGGGAEKSGFDALEPDVQAYAREQIPKFVGEGKMFKDEKSWLEYFAEHY